MENIHYFDQFSELHRKPYCRKRTVKNRTVMNWIPIFQNLLIASLIHFSACVNCPRRIYNLASWINTSQFSLLIESDWTNIFIADSKSPSCSDTNPEINKIFDWFLKNIWLLQLRYSSTDHIMWSTWPQMIKTTYPLPIALISSMHLLASEILPILIKIWAT